MLRILLFIIGLSFNIIVQCREVTIHLHLVSVDEQVLFLEQISKTGKIHTDTLYYNPQVDFKKTIFVEPGTSFIYLNTHLRSQVSIYLSQNTSNINLHGVIKNAIFDSISFDNDKANTILYKYLTGMINFSASYGYIQDFIKRYPYDDSYIGLLISERNKKLKLLENQKNKSVKSIPSKDTILIQYINTHFKLISTNIKEEFKMQYFDYLCNHLHKYPNLLCTDLPDALIGSVMMYYSLESDSLLKEKILDATDSILFNNKNISDNLPRMGGHYLYFLNDIKQYQRIDNLFRSGIQMHNDLNKLLIGQNASIPISNINKSNIPIHISDFRKRYNIIFIWSTDCGHCRQALSPLNDIYEENQKKSVQFYSLNISPIDTAILNKLNWKIKGSIDNGWDNSFLQLFKINYTPLILVVNEKGIIISQPSDITQLNDFIKLMVH